MGIKTRFVLFAVLSLALTRPQVSAQTDASSQQDSSVVVIDASAPAHPFPGNDTAKDVFVRMTREFCRPPRSGTATTTC